MRSLFVVLLLVAAVAAGNWNTYDFNNRQGITTRDALHQKFILNLLRHLQNDLKQQDFVKYSHTIKVDNKNDYKDLTKVFTFMQMFRNGMFVRRGHTFNILDKQNVMTTKALFDFFDTTTNWNAVAMNLIWCRYHINEYQFYHLMTLLVTHHREFNNIVLPAMYEVLPTQFFTGDVMNQGMKGLMLNFDNLKNNQVVVMQNFSNGMMGSLIDDDNDNFNDLNDIKNNYIKDWDTLKKVVDEIHDQTRTLQMVKTQNVNDYNKDIKTKIHNNVRNLNQGNKFDNNGEDRMNYFTQDIGLNNYYYFTRFGNSRVIDDKQMYNNINNKGTFQFFQGTTINSNELKDKINRRGERYLYQMQQLLARYNLERLSNGLNNVKQAELDGKIDNGVFTKLRFTNGLQMFNRMNGYQVNNDNTRKLVGLIKDFEDRYMNAIDQGYVETLDGKRIDLNDKYGFNTLGNLLQGNSNNFNTHYYRNLERFYRLVFGGNYINNLDRFDRRFNPTVMGQDETTLRDPVFWQVMKRINNIGKLYKDKLVGYTKKDTDFKGVKINNVKVDKMLTTFGYFDADITNGFNVDLVNMCKRKNNFSYNRSFKSGSFSRTREGVGKFKGSFGRSNSKSFNRSDNRTFLRILKNWSNNRTTMRKNLSKNFSTIRRVMNKSRYIKNNSVRRIMNKMNISNKRFGANSTSRVRRLFNNRSIRRIFKNKLNKSGNRSFGGKYTKNFSWRNVFGLRKNKTVDRSAMRRFNRYGKFNNKFVRRNYRFNKSNGSSSSSSSSSSSESNSRSYKRGNGNFSGRRNFKRSFNRSNRQFGSKSNERYNLRNFFGLRKNYSNSKLRKMNKSGYRGFNKSSSGSGSFSRNSSYNRSKNYSNNRSFGSGSYSRTRMNKFGNTNKSVYFRSIMGLKNKFGVFGRQRRLDTKKFTVTIDVTSEKTQFGIVRIFLGPRINNKQQLNDNRQNFVELDQFIVKLKDGQNIIKRDSIDFKNVVGNPETFGVLYMRASKFIKFNDDNNKGGDKSFNTLFNLNYDTNNNNYGFPHRLLLPKGTIGGKDYTLFVTVNDMDQTNFKNVKYINGKNWNNFVKDTIKDNRDDSSSSSSDDSSSSSSDDSSSSSDSNSSSSSFSRSNSRGRSNSRSFSRGRLNTYERRMKGIKYMRFNRNKMVNFSNKRNFNSKNRSGGRNIRVNNLKNVWCKNGNGVMIYNCNNGNKNIGNGNGVLDNRAMGFPLDRRVIDVNGFIVDNMFFKDVTIFHVDTSNNN